MGKDLSSLARIGAPAFVQDSVRPQIVARAVNGADCWRRRDAGPPVTAPRPAPAAPTPPRYVADRYEARPSGRRGMSSVLPPGHLVTGLRCRVHYERAGRHGTPRFLAPNAAGRGTGTIPTTTASTTTVFDGKGSSTRPRQRPTSPGGARPSLALSLPWHSAALGPAGGRRGSAHGCPHASERGLALAVRVSLVPALSRRSRRPAGLVTANAAKVRRGGKL